jgi:hypothetical protein
MDGQRTLTKRAGNAVAAAQQAAAAAASGSQHPLTSFSGMHAVPPPPAPMGSGMCLHNAPRAINCTGSPHMQIVRPVTVTTTQAPRQAKPAGIVIGSTKTCAAVLPNSARQHNFVSMAPSCSDSASQKDTDSDLQVRSSNILKQNLIHRLCSHHTARKN